MNEATIKTRLASGALRWTQHIVIRLIQRGIAQADVECALAGGEIIEQYPGAYPHPACLVLGCDANGKALHVVCGDDGEAMRLITAYYPDLNEWAADLKTRREKS